MKNTGICPKCQSNDIIRINGEDSGHGPGNNIRVGLLARVLVHKYVCCNCGYTEEWVDTQNIPKVEQYYNKDKKGGNLI